MRECTPAQSQQTQAARLNMRMQREIKLLQTEPPPGVCAWPSHHHLITCLEAQIEGAEGTVYAKGIFKLQIQVPDRYPFEPPNVRFVTPIYHPNIDNGGRICLDILNLPPKGAWRPSLNIATVLASIGLLLSEPNPDDGLMGDISSEYKHNRSIFDRKARLWTQKYAVQTECQTNSLTTETSRPGGSLQIGQGSNEIIGTLEQMTETAKKVATEVKNQANIEWELKDKGHVNPAKSTLPLSRKLSLTREPLVQPTKGSSPEEMVTQAKEQFYNGNLDLQSAQNSVTEASQKLSISSVLGEKMHQKVGIDDSASRIHNAFKGVGGGEEEDVFRDKENLQPRCWNAEIPPPNLSALKGLESDPGTCLSMNGMKRRQNTQKLLLHNNTSVHSNQNTTYLTTNQGTKRHDELVNAHHELVNAHPLKSKTHEFPISRPHQPEENNVKENTNGRVHVRTLKDVPTIIVSDSESDEEPTQVRSRLSLLQRKRKATYNG